MSGEKIREETFRGSVKGIREIGWVRESWGRD